MLDKEGFSQLLPDAVQAKKLKNNTDLHPQNRAWLDKVWGYLCQNFQDLQRFEELPILPVHLNDGRYVQLHLPARSSSISIQLVQHQGKSIPQDIAKHLETLNVFLAASVLDKAGNHRAIFDHRVALPSPDGVLQSLSRQYQYKGNEVITAFNKLDASVRKAFRKFISQSGDIGCHKDVVRKLEIFPRIEIGPQRNSAEFDEKAKMDKKLLALDDAKDAVKLKYLPQVPLPWTLIDVTLPECEHLVKVLDHFVIHTQVSIFSTHILPELEKGGAFAKRFMKDISLFMLQHHELINEKEIVEQVQRLHCIPTRNGFALPSKTCNPQSRILQELFKDQDVFPLNPFTEGTIIPQLEKVGMKNEDDLTADDILTAVKDVDTRAATAADPTSCEVLKRKSQAIASFLGKRPRLLQQFPLSIPNNVCHLKGLLLDLHWLPMCCEPPKNIPYPISLPWWNDTKIFQKPTTLKKMNDVSTYLIGSVQPLWEGIPGDKEAEASIVEHFNMDSPPDVRSVVQQLAILQKNYNEEEKTLFELIVNKIYHFLEQHAEAAIAEVGRQALSQWIWHGNGFASQDQVLCSDSVLDLRPYMYTVPDFFAKDHLPFKSLTSFEPYLDVLIQMKEKYDGSQQLPLGILANSESSDLKLSVEILNQLSKLAKDGGTFPDDIPMPLRSSGQLKFGVSSKCVFLDAEHLGKDISLELEKENVHVLHRDIPIATADDLGVPPLLRHLLKPEDLPFEEFGQGQSLCSIISNILDGYQDGFAFIKEMIQNADDAGATEVRFLFDARENKDYRKSLIDKGMAECQGQALWVYNDTVFKPVDFERIIKVGGGMKKEDAATIGRFGKGFNIVYNITDTPSFISQNNFVIFDPNAHHLGRAIKDKSKPGVKIDLDKTHNRGMIADQLAPFENIFQCRMNNRFNGTLFRLPLRTNQQSQKTELKPGKPYTKEDVLDLFRLTIDRSESLLLFIQNVVKFSLWYLSVNSKDPSDAVEIFIIEKDIPKRCIQPVVNYKTTLPKPAKKLDKEKQQLIQATRILHAASNAVQRKEDHTELKCMCHFSITCSTRPHGGELLQMVAKDKTREYFLTSYMSTGEAFSLAVKGKNEGTLPVASIALPVQSRGNKLKPLPLNPTEGVLFCQLPLPISTSLPVHVSGTFLTTSSRNHLVQRSADDRQNVMAEWNEALLRETLPKAYIFFLEKCKEYCNIGGDFLILWPMAVKQLPEDFLQSFHRKLMTLNEPKLLTDGQCWRNFHEVVYLEPSFQDKVGIGEVAYNIFRWWVKTQPGNKIAVHLPMKIVEQFKSCEMNFNNEYSRQRFYKEVFFANIAEMQAFAKWRDTLMRNDVLPSVTNDEEMASFVRTQKCIPVMPSGNVLETPGKLVSERGMQSIMFTEEDGVFPLQEYREQSYFLQKLGMRCTVGDITWAEVSQCAKQTLSISDRSIRVRRILNILMFIGFKRMEGRGVDDVHVEKCELEELKSIPFLPVLQTFPEYPLPLFDHKKKKDILYDAPQNMGLLKVIDLVGSAMPIVDETLFTRGASTLSHIPPETFQFIGCVTNPGIETIQVQMQAAISYGLRGILANQLSNVQRLMRHIYSYLQELCKQEQDISSALKGLPVVLVDDHFVQPKDVVFSLKNSCEPYLYALPKEYISHFEQLFTCLGVRHQFDVADYIAALKKMSEETISDEDKPNPLIEKAEKVANMLIEQLKEEKSKDLEMLGDIVLPDIHGIFRRANELTVWNPNLPQRKVLFLHRDVRLQDYECLGIKQPHEGVLSKYSSSIPFGQQVQLERSITRILKGYSPEDMFKEVLQNADDAGATEVHFVLDQRTHNSEYVPGESWKQMQGPALCIFNNASFTDSDLTAIATLGSDQSEMENKSRNPYKTGQFGIGFNSVYHITDTPWIVTRGSCFEVLQDPQGKYEDICCVFDPLRKYVPGATVGSPGQLFNLQELAEDYPDVKSCLLEEQFDLQGKTLLRLPLRYLPRVDSCTHQDLPAWKSLDIRKVKDLLETFKAQMPQMLLFLKHIKQIHVSEIDNSTGNIKKKFSSTSEICQNFLNEYRSFHEGVQTVANHLKSRKYGALEIPCSQVTYELTIQTLLDDQPLVDSVWSVVQQLGSSTDNAGHVRHDNNSSNLDAGYTEDDTTGDGAVVNPNSVIQKSEDDGQLTTSDLIEKKFDLLPLGAVAALKDTKEHWKGKAALKEEIDRRFPKDTERQTYSSFSGYKTESIKKHTDYLRQHDYRYVAACFLPLPIKTGLRVMLNGHFELGYEDRRTIPNDDKSSGRWNVFLQENVLAPCYVKLVKHMRNAYLPQSSISKTSWYSIDTCLSTYSRLFPVDLSKIPPWKPLFISFFKTVVAQQVPLLPVLKRCPGMKKEHTDRQENLFQVLWFPPSGIINGESAFFNTLHEVRKDETQTSSACVDQLRKKEELKMSQIVEKILLGAGFNLMHIKDSKFKKCFSDVGFNIPCVSPQSVLEFFKTFEASPACTVGGKLPMPLEKTIFKDTRQLLTFLKYLYQYDQFPQNLNGLPFLVTKDSILRQFTTESKCFYTKHDHLLPELKFSFIHEDLRNFFEEKKLEVKHCNQLQYFTVSDFAELLAQQKATGGRYGCLFPDDGFASPLNKDFPNEEWAGDAWRFISDECKEMSHHKDRYSRTLASLSPLNGCALIPAYVDGRKVLVCIGKAYAVMNFDRPEFIHDDDEQKMMQMLKSLNVAVLLPGACDVIENITGSVFKVDTVLKVLCEKLQESQPPELDSSTKMLRFFSKRVSALKNIGGCKAKLLELPVYRTVYGKILKIGMNRVYTLPRGIPSIDMEAWKTAEGLTFLQHENDLEPLYDFLNFKKLTVVDMYCGFIFKHFEYLSLEGQAHHLKFLYLSYLSDNYATGEKKETRDALLEDLKGLPFLFDSREQCPQTASHFYDPFNKIFVVMQCNFPPSCVQPFDPWQWISFLRIIGMVSSVSKEMFVAYVQEVARTKNADQSKVLGRNLMSNQQEWSAEDLKFILQSVRDIPFVCAQPASQCYVNLMKQYGNSFIPLRSSVPCEHEALVWTSANLLPDWANPWKYSVNCKGLDSHALATELGILQKPTLSMVLCHISALSDKFHASQKGPSSRMIPSCERAVVSEVMKFIYMYLKENGLLNDDTKKALGTKSVILVGDHKRFAKPKRVVLNMYEDKAVPPHLYKAPSEFGEFFSLFTYLGCTESPSVGQYAAVLVDLYKQHKDKDVTKNPNILRSVYRAVNGLFKAMLIFPEQVNSLRCLYLPSKKGLLLSSQKLVYINSPRLTDRIQTLYQYEEFLVDLNECGVRTHNFEDLLNSLPQSLQPKRLKDVVEEHLVENGDTQNSSEQLLAQHIQQRISSTIFAKAIERIARHQWYMVGHITQDSDEKSITNIPIVLHQVKVIGMDEIQTCLKYKAEELEGSLKSQSCFAQMNTATSSSTIIYIREGQESCGGSTDDSVYFTVADVINRLLPDISLNSSILYVVPILKCKEEDIHKELDRLDVRELHDSADHHLQQGMLRTLPVLGTAVPVDVANTLVPVDRELEVDEYVAIVSASLGDGGQGAENGGKLESSQDAKDDGELESFLEVGPEQLYVYGQVKCDFPSDVEVTIGLHTTRVVRRDCVLLFL
ncbi:sacsin-like [Lingula anatina]|uniref:Sacsin-like n=1 Tax=Lingula anatina TaxID=7574 RepID=A0A2R2MKP7_LINAN|nr:sacsin-like [Lingula anatina]|eukprot:XP_023930637.1 sacsin-like [Lingula anatina]